MRTKRSNFAAVVAADGRIFAFGGYDGNFTPLSTVEACTP